MDALEIPADAVRLIWWIQTKDSDQVFAFASVPAREDQRKTARRKINKNHIRNQVCLFDLIEPIH